MLLSNRVALITGGAKGIGKGIALKFSDEGCSIVIADVLAEESAKTLEEILKKGTEAFFVQCDVSKSREVKGMVDQTITRFGKVDILVNNAGISSEIKSITDVSEEEWDRVLATNLKGVFLCCKAVVPHMRNKCYGKIINISSGAAVCPPASIIHYSASKAGILGLTLDLALELAPFNICVNAIIPGAISTEMWGPGIPSGINKEDFFKEVGKMISPMERVGTPEEIAGAALFLASELSSYVTGDRIIVGGGYPLLQRFINPGKTLLVKGGMQ